MLWILSLHVIFMVTWFSGLFYLPRLFVYHSMATDSISLERFKIMERKLYYGIATPGALLTIVFGIWLVSFNPSYYMHSGWFHAKIGCVLLLVIYHGYCAKLLNDFKHNRNTKSHVFYRWFNEIPVVLLVAIVILVLVKPF